MTATTVTYAICTCTDALHAYPDCDRPDDMSTNRFVAEAEGAYIAGSIPRHTIRRTALVTVDVMVEARAS